MRWRGECCNFEVGLAMSLGLICFVSYRYVFHYCEDGWSNIDGGCCYSRGQENLVFETQMIRGAAMLHTMEFENPACPHFEDLVEKGFLKSNVRNSDPWGYRYDIRCSQGDVQVSSRCFDGERIVDVEGCDSLSL